MGQAGVTPALTRNRDADGRPPRGRPGAQPENPRPFGSFVSLSWNADRSHPGRAGLSQRPDIGVRPRGGNRVPCPSCPAPGRPRRAARRPACPPSPSRRPTRPPTASGASTSSPTAPGPSPRRARTRPCRRTAASTAGASPSRDEESTRYPRAVLTFDAALRRPRRPRPARSASASSSTTAAQPTRPTATTPPEPTALCAVVAHRRDEHRCAGRSRRTSHREGLVCAVAGYPATDCGGEVKEAQRRGQGGRHTRDHRRADRRATPTPAADATAPAAASAQPTRGGHVERHEHVAAYVIAALALLALVAYLLVRSRAAGERNP